MTSSIPTSRVQPNVNRPSKTGDGCPVDLEALYARPALPALLARVTAPTRIVWGRQDQIIPVECGDPLPQAIPGSDFVVLEHCGHAPHLEKPDEFVRIALDFFL